MANSKISALPAASTPLAGTELVPVVQGGITEQVSVANLTAGRAVSAASLSLTTTPLPVASGGTGLASWTANGVVYASGTTTLTNGSALTFDGTTLKNKNASSGTYMVLENSDPSIGGGEAIQLQFNYTTVAALSTNWNLISRYAGGNFQFISNTNGAGGIVRLILESGGPVTAGADNAQTLGSSSVRWSVVYAATGTINTSDARSKQDEKNISEAEKATAIQIKGLLKSFRFKDAVIEKGDRARIHFGAIAQEVAQAFVDNGLDPEKYAMFCFDKWDDKFEPVLVEEKYTDENGEIKVRSIPTGEMRQTVWAGDRFGLRYEELLCFIIASM